jgi:hypothetical protein
MHGFLSAPRRRRLVPLGVSLHPLRIRGVREGSDKRAGKGYLSAWMRSAGTSTSLTPRKENKSFTRYFGGCSEVCFTM